MVLGSFGVVYEFKHPSFRRITLGPMFIFSHLLMVKIITCYYVSPMTECDLFLEAENGRYPQDGS